MSHEPAASLLTLDIERKGDVVVVKCHGRLVSGVNSILYAKVSQLIPGTKRIVLDLKDLVQMDSLGLGTLVRLYVSAKSAGCELQLTHLGKRVRELLGMTHLLSVFTVIGEQGIKIGF